MTRELPAWTPGKVRCDWRGRVPRREDEQAIFTPHGSLTHKEGRCDREGTEHAAVVDSHYCRRHITSKQARGE